LPKFSKNCQKLPKIANNCQKLPKIYKNSNHNIDPPALHLFSRSALATCGGSPTWPTRMGAVPSFCLTSSC
jgi:hypothetical protein